MNVHLSQDVSNFVNVLCQSIKLKLLYAVCTVDMSYSVCVCYPVSICTNVYVYRLMGHNGLLH